MSLGGQFAKRVASLKDAGVSVCRELAVAIRCSCVVGAATLGPGSIPVARQP